MNAIRIKIISCILALVILLSCSSPRTLYNNAGLFLLNLFDVYFELNEQQRLSIKKGLKKLFDWHKKYELPKTVLFLEEIRLKYEKGIKEEDINWTRIQPEEFWKRVLNHIRARKIF